MPIFIISRTEYTIEILQTFRCGITGITFGTASMNYPSQTGYKTNTQFGAHSLLGVQRLGFEEIDRLSPLRPFKLVVGLN